MSDLEKVIQCVSASRGLEQVLVHVILDLRVLTVKWLKVHQRVRLSLPTCQGIKVQYRHMK